MELPVGWTNPTLEAQLIKFTAQSRRILEIGSFVGRSTCVIANAIKLGGRKVNFDTCDLHFATTKEFRDFYAQIYGKSIEVPALHRQFLGTSESALKHNLAIRGLLPYVNALKGCFVDLSLNGELLNSYDMIHCDVSHDIEEINYNFPYIKKLLSKTRSVMICDNITNPEQMLAILNQIPFTTHELINTTFIGQFSVPGPSTQVQTGQNLRQIQTTQVDHIYKNMDLNSLPPDDLEPGSELTHIFNFNNKPHPKKVSDTKSLISNVKPLFSENRVLVSKSEDKISKTSDKVSKMSSPIKEHNSKSIFTKSNTDKYRRSKDEHNRSKRSSNAQSKNFD